MRRPWHTEALASWKKNIMKELCEISQKSAYFCAHVYFFIFKSFKQNIADNTNCYRNTDPNLSIININLH